MCEGLRASAALTRIVDLGRRGSVHSAEFDIGST